MLRVFVVVVIVVVVIPKKIKSTPSPRLEFENNLSVGLSCWGDVQRLLGRCAEVAGEMCKDCRRCAKVAGGMCKGVKVKSTPSPRPKTGV